MRLQKSPQRLIEHAYRAALEPSTNEEDDREFRDFIESVSVTQDELAAIASMSEFPSVSVTFEVEQGADPRPQPVAAINGIQRQKFVLDCVRQLAALALQSLRLAGFGFSRPKR